MSTACCRKQDVTFVDPVHDSNQTTIPNQARHVPKNVMFQYCMVLPKKRFQSSDFRRLQTLNDIKVLKWRSVKNESVLEHLWKSPDPEAMTTLRQIVDRFSLEAVLRKMDVPFMFLNLLFSDAVVFKTATKTNRRRIVFDILRAMKPMESDTFHDIFKIRSKRVQQCIESFIGTKFATTSDTRDEYSPVFLNLIEKAMPPLLTTVTGLRTIQARQSAYAPPTYMAWVPRELVVDMLVASLTHNYISESRSLVNASIRSLMSPSVPWSLSIALEIAVLTGNVPMFSRTISIVRTLRRAGIVFTDWTDWHLQGYTIIHAALLYGELDMAIDLVKMGIDPRYPFVFDPDPGSTTPMEKRRRVIPTMDLVYDLSTHNGISSSKIRTLTDCIRLMSSRYAKDEHRVRHTNKVTAWTSHTYRDVQSSRRAPFKQSKLRRWLASFLGKQGGPPTGNKYLTENLVPGKRKTLTTRNVNSAVSKHMYDHSLRAPTMPREMYWRHVETPRALFRGVHGPIAQELRRKGTYHDNGFVATSIREEIAVRFQGGGGLLGTRGTRGLIMRFDIAEIPPGTPWIWFSNSATPQSNMQMSLCDEGEVLLPPGSYTLGPRLGKGVYKATYIPDKAALSLQRKRITR